MKIFVTGASGYIGNAVARALRRAGHDVWGLVRSEEKARLVARDEICPVPGDITQPATWRAAAEACAVLVHCAADAARGTAGPDRTAVGALLDAAGQGGRTIVYTSGVWIYGPTGLRAVDEDDAPRPLAVVQWRQDHERMVLGVSHARGLVLRPGCVYGGRGGMAEEWFASAVTTGRVRVVGDGRNRWAMVHVEDLADAYVRAIESEGAGVFNVTDRSRDTVGAMAEAVAAACGAPGAVDYVPLQDALAQMGPRAEALAVDQHVDSRRAVRLLGWQPRHGGFRDAAALYLEAWKALR